mgnify:CR=1 FL=1
MDSYESIKKAAKSLAKHVGVGGITVRGLAAYCALPLSQYYVMMQGRSITELIEDLIKEGAPIDVGVSERLRKNAAVQREIILCAALNLAVDSRDYRHLDLVLLAGLTGISTRLIRYHYPDGLGDAIVRRAISDKIIPIIAQGLVVGDLIANAAPNDLRIQAAEWVKQ